MINNNKDNFNINVFIKLLRVVQDSNNFKSYKT